MERISIAFVLIENGSRTSSNIERQRFGGFGGSCDEQGVGKNLRRMLVSRYILDNHDKSSSSVRTLIVVLSTLHTTPSSSTLLSLSKSTRKRIFCPHRMLATSQRSTSVGMSSILQRNSALRSSSVLRLEERIGLRWADDCGRMIELIDAG